MSKIVVLFLFYLFYEGTSDNLNQWNDFKIKFNRAFNETENKRRFEIFEKNLLKIEAHNELESKGKETFRLGVNRYADMTFNEIVELQVPENYSNTVE
jgi:hypothetical protein